jgi:guanine deaminase
MSGNDGLILPVITPRFIPSCTDDLLLRLRQDGAGDRLPCANALLGERLGACNSCWQRCGVTDTAALEHFGLLSRRTILAHGNF